MPPDSRFSATKVQTSPDTIHLSVHGPGNAPLSRREVFDLWTRDDAFCAFFSGELASAPMEAFFWETPASTTATLDLSFECMLTRAPALARQGANPRPFSAHIGNPGRTDVVRFANIGGDAELIVPCDSGGGADHAHLAAFLRTADAAQVNALWRRLSEAAAQWLERDRPFWISTSGLGVAWLHVRIDTTPKYYAHRPYRQAD